MRALLSLLLGLELGPTLFLSHLGPRSSTKLPSLWSYSPSIVFVRVNRRAQEFCQFGLELFDSLFQVSRSTQLLGG